MTSQPRPLVPDPWRRYGRFAALAAALHLAVYAAVLGFVLLSNLGVIPP